MVNAIPAYAKNDSSGIFRFLEIIVFFFNPQEGH